MLFGLERAIMDTDWIERERLRLLAETNKFLSNVDQEQSKMTRELAELRLRGINKGAWQDNLITALEALGLLKFEEEKKDNKRWLIAGEDGNFVATTAQIKDALKGFFDLKEVSKFDDVNVSKPLSSVPFKDLEIIHSISTLPQFEQCLGSNHRYRLVPGLAPVLRFLSIALKPLDGYEALFRLRL